MRLLPLPDGPDSGQAFAADLFGSVPSGPVEGESEGELMDQALMGLVRRLVIDDPWSREEGFSECLFCGSTDFDFIGRRIVYIHEDSCAWIEGRRLLGSQVTSM